MKLQKHFIYRLLKASMMILVIGLIGCGKSESTTTPSEDFETETKSGGTLKVAYAVDPDSIDWMYTGATATRDVGWHIFETLFALDKDYKTRPMIAEDYEISDDQKTYTIHIRKDVTFHDGSIVTADDVISSIERWRKVSSVGQITSEYIEEINELDEVTVEIKLNEVYNSLLADFAAPKSALMIIPTKISKEAGEQPLQPDQLIGTGPYQFESWDKGHEIVITKFDNYSAREEKDWGGLTGEKIAYFDAIQFQIVKDPQVMMNGLKTDLYDYAEAIPPDLYEVVESSPHIDPVTYIEGYTTITPNKSTAPFDDLNVRRALNYALDKEAIAKSVYGNEQFYQFDGALFDPEQIELYSEKGTEEYFVFDQEKAKSLLEASDYNGETIKVMFSNNHQDYIEIAEIAKQQLENIGFNVELISYEWATYLEKWADSENWDLVVIGWSTRFSPNELGMLGIGTNSSGFYESEQWEHLLEQWSSADKEEKKSILAAMNETVWDELPFIKIVNKTTLDMKSNQIKDYDSWVGQRFWNTWKSE